MEIIGTWCIWVIKTDRCKVLIQHHCSWHGAGFTCLTVTQEWKNSAKSPHPQGKSLSSGCVEPPCVMKSVCWSSSALLNPNGSSKNYPLCKEWLWRTAAAPSRLLTFHQMRAINRCWTELESKTGSRVGYFGESVMVQLLVPHSWDDFVKFHWGVPKVHTQGLS